MSKIIKYISYALLVISAIFIVIFYVQIGSMTQAEIESGASTMLSVVLNWAIILLVVCAICAVIMPFFFSTGKGIKNTLIKVAVIVVLFGISYLLASGSPVEANVNPAPTFAELKWTDTGLILTCILFVGAVLAILSGSVINIIKNR